MKPFTYNASYESTISASPERTWELLSDFSGYPEWNPLTPKMKCSAQQGARGIGWLVVGPSFMRVPYSPKIVTADANRELRWKGGVPLVFYGDHRFIIEPDGDGTKLVHRETFRGLIPFIGRPFLAIGTKRAYKQFNKAIDAYAAE